MPIYEYQCKACHEKVEVLQKISDKELKQCPHCKKKQLVKLVSAAGFRLKGAGWYETDFKSGKKKNVHGSETASTTTAETSGSASTSDKAGAAS